ncbi:MAG: hypothetical protein AAGA23_16620 [Pseudomonadota bacterium]
MLGFSTLVSLWALVIARLLPGSPYWLAEKGRTAEAGAAIRRLAEGRIEPVTKPGASAKGNDIAFLNIFRGGTLRTTLIQSVINFCFSWGYWGLATRMPTLLAKRGHSAPEGLGFIALSALFMFPG